MDFISRLDSFAVIKSVLYLLHDKDVSHNIPAAVCVSYKNLLSYVSALATTSVPHTMECAYLSFALPTSLHTTTPLQLLHSNSIIDVIAMYIRAEMCFFIGIHSTKDK